MSFPTSPALEQGRQALAQQNVPLAIQLLGGAVAANPNDAGAMALLGMAYSQAGQHALARQYLLGATQRQPGNAGFRYQLGLALERAGDSIGAAQAYREALRINPGFADAQARLRSLPSQRAQAQTAPSPAPPQPRAPFPPASMTPAAPVTYSPSPYGAPTPAGGYIHQPAPGYIPTTATPAIPDMPVGEAFWRRVGAWLIDGALMGVVNWGLFLLTSVLLVVGMGSHLQEDGPSMAAGSVFFYLIYISPILIMAGYMAGMHSWRGQTLGKMAMGIRVMRSDGGRPSFGQAVVRDLFGRLLTALFCGLGYLWMLWDPQQQTWADKIASTYVRRA